MAQPGRNRRHDLHQGFQQGIAYYGCRFIEKFQRIEANMPDRVITSAMRFYHFATRDRSLTSIYRLNEVAAASFAISYANHLEMGGKETNMNNQNPNPKLVSCKDNIFRRVVDMWQRNERYVTNNMDLLQRLSLLAGAIISRVDTKNVYIHDGRDVLDWLLKRQMFSYPLSEQDLKNIRNLARAYITDWYYIPASIGFDAYQTGVCAIYTAKMTLGIETSMNKQANFKLRSEGHLNAWAGALFQFYEVYPTIQHTYNNEARRSGWISVERTKEGGRVDKEGLHVWDYLTFPS